MRQKVMFETNVPLEACLAHPEGKEIGGRRGEQVMYDLADGRLMFVPPSVRDQLRKSGIKPGERFQICRREIDDQGEEAGFQWTVSRCVSTQTPSAMQLLHSNNGSPAPARSASEGNGGSGHTDNEAIPKKNGQAKLSFIMQMALQGALDATLAVERYAEDSGII